MKIALIVALVVILTVVIAVFSRRNKDFSSSMRHFRINLIDGWYEVPTTKSPRMFRRKEEGSGLLRISLHPPRDRKVTNADEAEQELQRLLDSLGMELGERMLITHETGPCGIIASSIYKSKEQGIMQFWLIPTEVSVFAFYSMGSLKTVKQEAAEANEMVKTARFE